MTTMLRQVLTAFEQADRPLSLNEMARELDITPGMLTGMIEYWVRKGKLRETSRSLDNCATCGSAEGCPFIVRLPRSYELVSGDALSCSIQAPPPCTCCH